MKNPFSLAFGKEPEEYISRTQQVQRIREVFIEGDTCSQVYIITGVRGSGKTVLLYDIARQFEREEGWEVIGLNSNHEMLTALVSKMNSVDALNRIFAGVRLSINIPGLSVSYEGPAPVTDPEMALERMLEAMKEKKRKLLVTVDEIDNSEHLRSFAATFQMMMQKDLPIFWLMTGLYENISDLQNEKNMTFLLRAPKMELSSLNRTGVITTYMRTCNVGVDLARRMADLTRGYAFAFQLLGYLFWKGKYREGNTDLDALMPEYDQQLEEFVYAKIWSSMSATDRQFLTQISQKNRYRVKDLLQDMNVDNNKYSVYRRRLARKGVIDVSERGYVSMALPRFDAFIQNHENL